jgi:O-antigen/teichoic acid export membrane protein
MVATLGATAASVASSALLVPAYGILGGGVALAASTTLLNAVTVFAVRRHLGLWPYNRTYLKPLAAGGLAFTGAYLLMLALPLAAGIPKVGVIAPMFLVAYVALLIIFGLSSGDRQLLTSFWASVRRPRLRETRAT